MACITFENRHDLIKIEILYRNIKVLHLSPTTELINKPIWKTKNLYGMEKSSKPCSFRNGM